MEYNNYLDVLPDCLLNYIFDIVALSYENDIKKVNKKVNFLKRKVKKLNINKIEDFEDDKPYFNISYGLLDYSMDNYLYSRMPYETICVISIYEKFVFKSLIIKNPIYYDFLVMCNMLFELRFSSNTFDDFDISHRFLEGYDIIDNTFLKKKYNFNAKKNITYITPCYGS